ncbi:MAG: hypothetical protein U1G07_21070 [Verrucomicrobiota bacterium]
MTGSGVGSVEADRRFGRWNKTSPRQWDWDMARFVMDRHHRQVIFSFADGSARAVKLSSVICNGIASFLPNQSRGFGMVEATAKSTPNSETAYRSRTSTR